MALRAAVNSAMALQGTQEKDSPIEKLIQGLGPAALILLLAYLLITVLQHSDVELIRPETRVDLSEFFKKLGGIPSGSIVTPLVDLKLSIFYFYLLGPLAVLLLHIYLVWRPTLERLAGVPLVKLLAISLPAVLVFAMSWRFAPYAQARPHEPEFESIGGLLTWWHATVLFLDAIVLVDPELRKVARHTPDWPIAARRWRSVARAATATQLAGTCGLAALSLWWFLGFRCKEIEWCAPLGLPWLITVPAAIFVPWWGLRRVRRLVHHGRTAPVQAVNPGHYEEDVPMHVVGLVMLMVTAAVILPTYGRPLDLSGAKLVAEEPSEAMLAALISYEARAMPAIQTNKAATAEVSLSNVRVKAWEHFGRGLDYSNWRFTKASFRDALMPLIRLDGADLRGANLIRANLTLAYLRHTKLTGAQLAEANLRQAQLTLAQGGLKSSDAPDEPPLNLGGAELQGANLTKADFRRAIMDRVTMDDKTDLTEAQFQGATFRRATLHNVIFTGADIQDATLEGAELQGANLTGANFRRAIMDGVIMDGNTTLAEAQFQGATFKHARLSNVAFTGADIQGADFCGADLTGADLSQVKNAAAAKFHYADLAKATLPGSLDGADFTGANIRGVTLTGGPRNLKRAVFRGAVQDPNFSQKPRPCEKEK
jgi:uncharacterized protein YjbI with pentapeptide repeats